MKKQTNYRFKIRHIQSEIYLKIVQMAYIYNGNDYNTTKRSKQNKLVKAEVK